MHYHNVRMQHM